MLSIHPLIFYLTSSLFLVCVCQLVQFHFTSIPFLSEKKNKEKVDRYKDTERKVEEKKKRERDEKLAVDKIYQLKITLKIVFHVYCKSLS